MSDKQLHIIVGNLWLVGSCLSPGGVTGALMITVGIVQLMAAGLSPWQRQ